MFHPLRVALGRVLAIAVLVLACIGHTHAYDELPHALVLRFEPSASALDQAAIRYAVERELGIAVTDEGSPDAATLAVRVSGSGEVELVYRPERSQVSRSVPVSGARDVPKLLAQLAGNLVRDQAGAFVAQVAPAPTPTELPKATEPAKTAPSPNAPAQQAQAKAARWLTSVLLGASFGPNEGATLTLAEAYRIGRFEPGLGIDLGAARVDATLDNAETTEDIRVTAVQLTAWAGLDVRLLGGEQAALKLGLVVGYRIAGILAGDKLSGSDGYFALAPRITAAFQVCGKHSVLLRGVWYVMPEEHTLSASEVRTLSGELKDGVVTAQAFNIAALVGYQVQL